MLKKSAVLLVLISLFFGLRSFDIVASSTDLKSSKLHLGDADYAEFVDFLYSFSQDNRLNTQWFGWYFKADAKEWYETSDERSKFKVNLHLLTEENGYLYFSNGFDERTVNMIINPGSQKIEWLSIINRFKFELKKRGYKIITEE